MLLPTPILCPSRTLHHSGLCRCIAPRLRARCAVLCCAGYTPHPISYSVTSWLQRAQLRLSSPPPYHTPPPKRALVSAVPPPLLVRSPPAPIHIPLITSLPLLFLSTFYFTFCIVLLASAVTTCNGSLFRRFCAVHDPSGMSGQCSFLLPTAFLSLTFSAVSLLELRHALHASFSANKASLLETSIYSKLPPVGTRFAVVQPARSVGAPLFVYDFHDTTSFLDRITPKRLPSHPRKHRAYQPPTYQPFTPPALLPVLNLQSRSGTFPPLPIGIEEDSRRCLFFHDVHDTLALGRCSSTASSYLAPLPHREAQDRPLHDLCLHTLQTSFFQTEKLDLPSFAQVSTRGVTNVPYYNQHTAARPLYVNERLPALSLTQAQQAYSSGTSSPRASSFSSASLSNGSSHTSYTAESPAAGPKTPSPTSPGSNSTSQKASGNLPSVAYNYRQEAYTNMNQGPDMYYSSHISAGQAPVPQTVTSGLGHYSHHQPAPLQPGPGQYSSTPGPYGNYGYSNGLASQQQGGQLGSMGSQGNALSLPSLTAAQPILHGQGYPPQPQGFDTTGQVAPPGMKPRVTATLWEDEGALCFQVEAKGICVARREGELLLNFLICRKTNHKNRQSHD